MGAPLNSTDNWAGTNTGRTSAAVQNTSAKPQSAPRKRGFALLDPERMRQVAALGGATAHKTGRAHQFTPAEARAAALKSVEKRRQLAAQSVKQAA